MWRLLEEFASNTRKAGGVIGQNASVFYNFSWIVDRPELGTVCRYFIRLGLGHLLGFVLLFCQQCGLSCSKSYSEKESKKRDAYVL